MAHDSDSDEVFTSAPPPADADVVAFDRIMENKKQLQTRLELAEAVADMLVEYCASSDGFTADADSLEVALVAWEGVRGSRFVYTDGTDHVIASGRGGLSKWLNEQGYDVDQSSWELVPADDIIAIWCDEDGDPCGEDDAGILTEKTAAQWLEKVKINGLLCSEDV